MLQRVDHIGVIVKSLDEAKQFLGETLGLKLDREVELPERAVKAAFYRCGDVHIEVIEVTDPEIRKQRLGEGVQARIEHIAIQVDNLEKTLSALGAWGVRTTFTEPVQVGTAKNLWTDPSTTKGVMYQLVEKG